MTLVLVLAAGIAFTIWRIQAATPNARPERVTPTVARDAATTCNAPLCTEPASIRIHAGHGWWHLCIGHGLPLLTEGLKS